MEKKAGQSSTDMFREMFDKSMNYTNLGMVEITFSPYVQCGSVDRSQNHVVHGSNTPALSRCTSAKHIKENSAVYIVLPLKSDPSVWNTVRCNAWFDQRNWNCGEGSPLPAACFVFEGGPKGAPSSHRIASSTAQATHRYP